MRYNSEELAQGQYESFKNWIARENILFKGAEKLEDPYSDFKNFANGINSTINKIKNLFK